MHSFIPGLKLSIKEDNWIQLSKILEKVNICKISQSDISRIINQQDDTAIKLLAQVHSHFTGKEVCLQLPPQEFSQNTLPRYAQSTASFKVKDSLIERTVDEMEKKLKRVEVILKHENAVRRSSEFPKTCTLTPTPVTVYDKTNTEYIISPPLVTVNDMRSLLS